MLQIGWKAGPEQYPPTELCDYAVVAEQAAFDSIDVSNVIFLHYSGPDQGAFLERYGRDMLPKLRIRG